MSENIVERLAGIAPSGPLGAALQGRADVMAMTEATHDAALKPADPGGLSHALRAALAARVARLNGEEALAAHYLALMAEAEGSEAEVAVADPAFKGDDAGRIAAILAFTDLVSMRPRDTVAADIEALQAAGLSDPDIVRLAELNAFLAYQIRVIAGLRLMRASA
ncbi:CMD domain-containing protein [Chelativorans intermedius]|uniref:CMD domain-containing protein n=1 Tax=Chelativorans intermedius TaxID=515947 RepID=A0ABV6D5I8_9HYPH|nr:hypothetical protein [Chelativorans intermedius]MCT8998824.1 hypothetical protein [Chelativorans intermedius]